MNDIGKVLWLHGTTDIAINHLNMLDSGLVERLTNQISQQKSGGGTRDDVATGNAEDQNVRL